MNVPLSTCVTKFRFNENARVCECPRPAVISGTSKSRSCPVLFIVWWDKLIAESFHIKDRFSGVCTSLKPWRNFALFVCFSIHASILGAFAKLLKATISCVMSVCQSIRRCAWNLAPTKHNFMKLNMSIFFENMTKNSNFIKIWQEYRVFDIHWSVHRRWFSRNTSKMQLCNRIYYSKVYWRLNMFRAAHRSSSGALNCVFRLWFIYPCSDRQLLRLNGVIEFIILKFIEGSTCFERQAAHHQELWTVFSGSGLYIHVVTGSCQDWMG
jgi:hypothetical protein